MLQYTVFKIFPSSWNILDRYISYVCISSNIYCLFLFCFSLCSPAIPLPVIKPPCTRLDIRFGSFCKRHGVNLGTYVFKTLAGQQISSSQLSDSVTLMEQLKPIYDLLNTSKICFDVAVTAFCHYHFASCDRTGSTIQERGPCKAMCDYLLKTCKKFVDVFQQIGHKYVNCSIFPIREAGSSPECWYYNGRLNGKLNTEFQKYLHKRISFFFHYYNCLSSCFCVSVSVKIYAFSINVSNLFNYISAVSYLYSIIYLCTYTLLNAPLITIKRLHRASIVSKVKPKLLAVAKLLGHTFAVCLNVIRVEELPRLLP